MSTPNTPVADEREGAGTTVDVTLTVTAGSYVALFAATETGGSDVGITFSVQAGPGTATITEIAAMDNNFGADFISFEGARAAVTGSGSITFRATSASSQPWAGLVAVEIPNIASFDSGVAWTRDTSSPLTGTALTPASAPVTRIAVALDWSSSGWSTPAVDTGWTSLGVGWRYVSFAGAVDLMRIAYREDASVSAVSGAFTGSGGNIWFIAQSAFIDSGGGGATVYTRRPLESPIFTSRVIK